MSVVKIVELIGSSERSWEDAVQEALRQAVGIDVLGCKAKVEDNRIVKYKARVRIAFAVER